MTIAIHFPFDSAMLAFRSTRISRSILSFVWSVWFVYACIGYVPHSTQNYLDEFTIAAFLMLFLWRRWWHIKHSTAVDDAFFRDSTVLCYSFNCVWSSLSIHSTAFLYRFNCIWSSAFNGLGKYSSMINISHLFRSSYAFNCSILLLFFRGVLIV